MRFHSSVLSILHFITMITRCWTILHVSSREKFVVAEGNQKSEEEARSGIGAWRRDFWIIRDNPLGRISVKKATYGVRQKECEGKQEGNFTAAVQTGTAEINCQLYKFAESQKFSNP